MDKNKRPWKSTLCNKKVAIPWKSRAAARHRITTKFWYNHNQNLIFFIGFKGLLAKGLKLLRCRAPGFTIKTQLRLSQTLCLVPNHEDIKQFTCKPAATNVCPVILLDVFCDVVLHTTCFPQDKWPKPGTVLSYVINLDWVPWTGWRNPHNTRTRRERFPPPT